MERRTVLKVMAAAPPALLLPNITPQRSFGWFPNALSLKSFIRKHKHPFLSQKNKAIKGSGKGKKVYLHKAYERVTGTSFTPHDQKLGDCFYAGTLVTMADGSQKPIEKVNIYDSVISHTGESRKVTNVIRKPYKGKMITVETSLSRLVCTPDHQFFTDSGWKEAKNLNLTDKLHITPQRNRSQYLYFDMLDFLPDAETNNDQIRAKNSNKWSKRFITFDEDFAFILGAYLAEGSGDSNSVRFNLCKNEHDFILKLQEKIQKVFGVDCNLPEIPSKPTVQIVSCCSKVVATLIGSLCPGNTYNKEAPKEIHNTSDEIKKAFLLGWFEGNGCCNGRKNCKWGIHFKLCGVTVSLPLLQGMSRLLSSLGLLHSITSKEPSEKAKAYRINVYSKTIFELYPEHKAESEEQHPNLKPFIFQEYGSTIKITKLSNISSVATTVYCLDIEKDHSFSANLISVHNCVSQAAGLGVDFLSAVQIAVKHRPQRWVAKAATEPIYGGSRVEIGNYTKGAGSTGHWTAEWLSQYGVLLRKKYPGGYDFTIYNPALAKQYGREGCPDPLEPLAKLHPVKDVAICTSYADMCDSIYNGCPVMVCSNVGFGNGSDELDSEGFLTRKARPWYHAMLFGGYDDEYRRPGALCFNSWGKDAVYGSTRGPQPPGSFWVDASTVDAMLRQGDSFAFSGFVGFPRVVIPPYIFY